MKIFFFFLLCLFIPFAALCQQIIPDSLFYKNAVNNVKSCYQNNAAAGIRFYNGPQYVKYALRTNGHPFFDKDTFITGNIFYDEALYRNVKLKYSLEDDNVVMFTYNNNFLFSPVREKTKFFSMGDHYFENTDLAGYTTNNLLHGFVERVYNGAAVKAYVKRFKKLLQPFRVEDSLPVYREYSSLFVAKGGEIFSISGKRSLLAVFHDKKNEIKSFMSSNDIHEINAGSLQKIAAYYELLKQ